MLKVGGSFVCNEQTSFHTRSKKGLFILHIPMNWKQTLTETKAVLGTGYWAFLSDHRAHSFSSLHFSVMCSRCVIYQSGIFSLSKILIVPNFVFVCHDDSSLDSSSCDPSMPMLSSLSNRFNPRIPRKEKYCLRMSFHTRPWI